MFPRQSPAFCPYGFESQNDWKSREAPQENHSFYSALSSWFLNLLKPFRYTLKEMATNHVLCLFPFFLGGLIKTPSIKQLFESYRVWRLPGVSQESCCALLQQWRSWSLRKQPGHPGTGHFGWVWRSISQNLQKLQNTSFLGVLVVFLKWYWEHRHSSPNG